MQNIKYKIKPLAPQRHGLPMALNGFYFYDFIIEGYRFDPVQWIRWTTENNFDLLDILGEQVLTRCIK